MSAFLDQTVGRSPDATPPATVASRSPRATYTLAATVAVISCLVLLAAVFIVVTGRVLGLYYSAGPFVELFLVIGVAAGLAGLVAAVVIAVIAAARRPSAGQPGASAAGASATAAPARRRVVLLGVAAVIVAASILLFLMFDALSLGYGVLGKLVQLGAAAVAVAGVVAAVIVLAAAMLPGRTDLTAHARVRRDRDGRAHPVVLPRRSRRVGPTTAAGRRRSHLSDGPGVATGRRSCNQGRRSFQRQRAGISRPAERCSTGARRPPVSA